MRRKKRIKSILRASQPSEGACCRLDYLGNVAVDDPHQGVMSILRDEVVFIGDCDQRRDPGLYYSEQMQNLISLCYSRGVYEMNYLLRRDGEGAGDVAYCAG